MTEAERVFCAAMVVGLRAMADEMSAILTREAPAAPAAPVAPAAECAEAPAAPAAECAEAPAPVDMVALRQMCVALAEAGKTDILRMWLASHGFDRVTQLDETLRAELVAFLKTQGVA